MLSKMYKWFYLPAVALVILVVVVGGLAASESTPQLADAIEEPAPVEPLLVEAVPLPVEVVPVTTTAAPHAHAIEEPAPVSDGCWADLARTVGWPEETIGTLQKIIRRESNCNPGAYANRPSTLDNSRGLLQINAYGNLAGHIRNVCGVEPEALFDPTVNLSCGLVYYRRSGWKPWGY